MFKSLLKTRIKMMINQFMNRNSNNKKRSLIAKIGITLLFLYVIACFFFMFGASFHSILGPFHAIKIDWLYFTMTAIMALFLMVVGSIFATQTQLYDALDNELLLSMPIPPKMILLSRMVALYLLNLALELLVFIPAAAVYYNELGVRMDCLIFLLLIAIVFPMFGLVLSCILGFIVHIISSHTRNKSLATIIFSLVFFAAYFYLFGKMNSYIEKLIENGSIFADQIKGKAAPLYWLGNAIANADIKNLLVTILWIAVLFIIMYEILAKTFISLVTTKKGFAKKKYVAGEMKVGDVKKALFQKEYKKLLSSPIYLLNSCLGVLFLLIGAVALIIKKEAVLEMFTLVPVIEDYSGPIIVLALCSVATVNIITAPSISLEGRTLWLLKSLPIKTEEILKTKLKLHLIITVPVTLLVAIVAIVVLPVSPIFMFLAIVTPVFMNLFIALFGLIVNLHFPKFDWVSEAAVVKQSLTVFITIFGSMAIVFAIALLYMYGLRQTMGMDLYISIVTAILVVACIGCYRYLMTKGVRIFEKF